jgi:hypothetical protein
VAAPAIIGCRNRRRESYAADPMLLLHFDSVLTAITDLLDHAVRPLQHLGRHRDADVPRRIEVHD